MRCCCSASPAKYVGNTQTTPAKHTCKSADPRNCKTPLPSDTQLERLLLQWDNIDKSKRASLHDLLNWLFWRQSKALPKPPQKAIDIARAAFHKLFYSKVDGEPVKKTKFKYDLSDYAKSQVDGAPYRRDYVPKDARPYWGYLRMLIDFKMGGTENDPFSDVGPLEAFAKSRSEAMSQLEAY
ncbi:hypothetical protein BD413DRAFT_197089 [Trametes elegans]|nr:hypothetical protein BD413DRAFT_197089 [Trametes elegans]